MTINEELKTREIFAKRLKALLEESKMSQVELSRMLGVSESSIGKWLLQKALPRMGIIEKLSSIFARPKSYFLEEDADTSVQSYYLDPETAKLAQEAFDDPDTRILLDAKRDLSPQDLQFVIDLVKKLKKE